MKFFFVILMLLVYYYSIALLLWSILGWLISIEYSIGFDSTVVFFHSTIVCCLFFLGMLNVKGPEGSVVSSNDVETVA